MRDALAAFPSNYLKASDLGGRPTTVTISDAESGSFGRGKDQETKNVVSFVGKSKKLICNKTNTNSIIDLYGRDMNGWIGKQLTLVVRDIEYEGKVGPAIRIASSVARQAAPAVNQSPDRSAPSNKSKVQDFSDVDEVEPGPESDDSDEGVSF